ncbi:hypothetical protein [uncultured Duncaniella sp.]|uniref:hypothetical protein n=1 Tax=uncultured Duncaniella sp. TaxID=2768039 RepID=UPI00260DBEFD|nr:hypothetical protein [uncultured Duncaniella sp.]
MALRQTIQTGSGDHVLRNEKSFQNFSYFLGGIDVTDQNLNQFTPYIRGVSRIFVHKLPPFMNQLYPDMSKRFKSYLETGYTSVDGIGDITVDFTDFEGGFAGQRYSTVSMSHDETENVTVQVYELSGSPIREYLDTWITGVRDPRSGIAHYHGIFDLAGNTISYGERNHTMEMFYVNLDPTARQIEYVAMFAHMMPTRVPKAHLNYEKGNHDNAQLDLEFRTTKYESPAINDIGYWYIQNSKVDYNYLDFNPTKGKEGDPVHKSAWTFDYASGTERKMGDDHGDGFANPNKSVT